MWEDKRESEGSRPALAVALAFLCMSDHPDVEAAGEKVLPIRFPRFREAGLRGRYPTGGTQGKRGNHDLAIPKHDRRRYGAPCLVWVIFILVGWSGS